MLQNKGDLAMIAVTVERVLSVGRTLGRGAHLRAQKAAGLPADAEPIAFSSGGHWEQPDWFDQLARRVGPAVVRPTLGVRSGARALVREPASVVRRCEDPHVARTGLATSEPPSRASPRSGSPPRSIRRTSWWRPGAGIWPTSIA